MSCTSRATADGFRVVRSSQTYKFPIQTTFVSGSKLSFGQDGIVLSSTTSLRLHSPSNNTASCHDFQHSDEHNIADSTRDRLRLMSFMQTSLDSRNMHEHEHHTFTSSFQHFEMIGHTWRLELPPFIHAICNALIAVKRATSILCH